MDDDDSDDFDYEQFLLAEQVRKYYYHGLYPLGILVIWTLVRADCYNLNGCDSLGNPPIVYASKCGSSVLLRLLLYYKADINAHSKLCETALIVACRNKRIRVIKLLLKRGAQTDLLDRSGYSALRWAVIHEHVDMVRLLLRYNASVTKDCNTSGSALSIARKGTSEQHAIILKELEEKLGAEREALPLGLEVVKQEAITEIDEYPTKREANKAAEKTTAAEVTQLAAQTTSKPTKRSRQPSSQKIVAGISRRASLETSVGTRVPTPPVEQAAWQSLEDGDGSSAWIKVAAGKWHTRKHLQETGPPIHTAETTMVEAFAPDKETVRKLLTNEAKWETFMKDQTPHRVSQAQLTVEDLD
ncbi:Protein tanc2 [Phytophthora pseudosyringae]|uniref:Protein tanc2 n=1 Tax=Phytophthora pseudosyringae TaxID=221518 RepID=A0A8T1W4R2_9STRA|nr:Protein tanc2 [Phytophthora pseudosyringae]